ncbi:hypothetical protein [Paraburkholderia rhynchosiae]|uniref:hypothetical protein n=1 Tax=Paraburkholderia rhynchosiae TaxID=487049 RepID=UPI0011AF25C9|nr:hypothetical protein [Paraburkholderia rhynchosiae]
MNNAVIHPMAAFLILCAWESSAPPLPMRRPQRSCVCKFDPRVLRFVQYVLTNIGSSHGVSGLPDGSMSVCAFGTEVAFWWCFPRCDVV